MNSQPPAIIPSSHALASVRSLASQVHGGAIYLVLGEPSTLFQAMQELIDRCALRGPVRVVVGGNRISFDHLPLILGDQTADFYEIFDRILVSRAETCFQMFDVLRALEPSPAPIVITDMLNSFYEEDIPMTEVSPLLQDCITRIKEISQHGPVLIGASGNPERVQLMQMLEEAADSRLYFQAADEEAQPQQYGFAGM
jgi:hypothetical protein